ncbi:heavy metal translocating P-type ATPase [Desulfovibrio piger]
MRFFLVHELSCSNGAGRLRARACRPMTQVQAEILADTLDAIDGVEGVRVNPRVPSVLVLYRHAQARQDVLRSLAAQDAGALNDGSVLATLTQELESSLERHASGSRLPAHDEDEMGAHGFGPLMRFLFVRPFLPFKLRVASSVMGALPFLRKGLASLLQGKLNVDVLDAAAIGVSLLRRDFRTVTVLTLLLGLGEALEYWTRRRSMDSLTESLALNVDTAWVLADGVETSVPLSDVREGDLVVVRDGGSIPVDGIVEDGEAVVNQASMTGEPLGVARSKGAAVYSGTVVEQGHLVIRATHVGDGTRLKQVVRFIEESEALKAGIQGKFERMADMAVPFTFALAGLVWLITRNPMQAASVLLVDYSCALRLATPLAVLAAMREGARHGVVIKGGRFLEALSEADTVVFDKTGTLTNASPHVVEVIPAAGHDRDEVLRLAACLEEHFPHPVARAVVRCAQEEGLQHEEEHAQVEYVVAHGIASTLYGKAVRVGSRHYIECDEGIDLSPLEAEIDAQAQMGRSLLYLAIDGKLAGFLAIEDPLRPECPQVLKQLEELGFRRILMLTGDDERTARAVAGKLGLKEYRSQVLPADKADVIADLTAQGCKVLMVGDGINDAPALSASHVGVAMCDGADLAREVANVLLTRPDLSGLITARLLGRATLRRIHINFAATMLLNSMFLAGGLFMILTPGVSALLHNLTTLGVTLNAMRPHLPGRHARQLEAA